MSAHINGKSYLSAREAGDKFGYTSDYISLLCRKGRVQAVRSGKVWFGDEKSLKGFVDESRKHEEERRARLRSERLSEYIGPIVVRQPTRAASTYSMMLGRVFVAALGISVFVVSLVLSSYALPLDYRAYTLKQASETLIDSSSSFNDLAR